MPEKRSCFSLVIRLNGSTEIPSAEGAAGGVVSTVTVGPLETLLVFPAESLCKVLNPWLPSESCPVMKDHLPELSVIALPIRKPLS